MDRCDKRDPETVTAHSLGKLLPPSAVQVAAFHTAVLRGDKPMARQFVKAGIPIDVPNHNGWTAIHIAALHNYRDVVRLLADSAAKLNLSEPQTGMTYYHNTMTGETSWQAPVELPYFVTTR